MADQISLPDDYREAVKMLPPSQEPFGKDFPLPLKFQSVFFHYDVPKGALKHFLDAVGYNRVSICMADPDSSDGKGFFGDAVKGIQHVAAVHKLRLAVRRICRPDPFAAIFKRVSSDSSSNASKSARHEKGESAKSDASKASKASSSSKSAGLASGDTSKGSKAADPAKASSPKGAASEVYEEVSDAELSDSDISVDSTSSDDVDKAKKAKSTGEAKCLNQLFNRVSNDVSTFWVVCLFLWMSFWVVFFVMFSCRWIVV